MLSSRVAMQFSRPVRSRGESYVYSRRVRLLSANPHEVLAEVQGTLEYHVSVQQVEKRIIAKCDCEYYEGGEWCKHVWAAIRAAESQGHLSAYFNNRSDLRLHRGEPFLLKPSQPAVSRWRSQVNQLKEAARLVEGLAPAPWPDNRDVVYLITGATRGVLDVEIAVRDRKRNGEWGKPKSLTVPRAQVPHLAASDREILGLIGGARESYYSIASPNLAATYGLIEPLATRVAELMCSSGHCYLRQRATVEMNLLEWDAGDPWTLRLRVQSSGSDHEIAPVLRRGDEEMPLDAAQLLTPGLVIARNKAARFEGSGVHELLPHLTRIGRISVPAKDLPDALAELLPVRHIPSVDLPPELAVEQVTMAPLPRLTLASVTRSSWDPPTVHAKLDFIYGDATVAWGDGLRAAYDRANNRMIMRDEVLERQAAETLQKLAGRYLPPSYSEPQGKWEINDAKFERIVAQALSNKWEVNVDGLDLRRPEAFNMEVVSGIDWFDLHGTVQYGSVSASAPELLEAMRLGSNLVRLSDGSMGLIPVRELEQFGAIATAGKTEGRAVRFGRNQVGLLDALLAARPGAKVDEQFARARNLLMRFDGIQPAEQPQHFAGELRHYQREGLAWMHFLRDFGFGGCLADDMGVGKTAQVLALLESRRAIEAGPSLVVVPKSLVFNWQQEAARFTPKLRVLDYTGLHRGPANFERYDLVVTTYGTLRREAIALSAVEFDYVVLDEAQAIKNANTESAKAARLLRGRNRLALSGTPVENHLGELWSLFEFLNPGMMGAAAVFKGAKTALRNPDEQTRDLLSRALRPFILRRTKAEVASELPARSEQTLVCELEPDQRRLYNELRDHYRQTLMARVERSGMARSNMHVLEALLRLRQAACHPALVDPERTEAPSAKLDLLMMQLEEVIEEGHKALVFSQFTSFLSLLRQRLDKAGTVFEYLDGRTRDRQERVTRFQTDEKCPLFLISLKAGGLGLNLTAADYVFLLDPWWNPAVEAQAIDRAHRIGQERHVFAYRLIAGDTVEEKILELQDKKRDLANAIIGGDKSLLRNLSREDLELLLS